MDNQDTKLSTKDDALQQAHVMHRFTVEDIDNCWQWYKSYLVDILNGEYDIQTARDDLMGLIGSRFDKRQNGA